MTNAVYGVGQYFSGQGQTWVLDITTASATAQMFLNIGWPSWNLPDLTQAQANATSSAMQTTVNGLTGVTSTSLNVLNTNGNAPGDMAPAEGVQLSAADWRGYQIEFTMTVYGSPSVNGAWLYTSSPADGVLTSADVDSVAAAIEAVIAAYSGVSNTGTYTLGVFPSTV
jgi:hypothetical protein